MQSLINKAIETCDHVPTMSQKRKWAQNTMHNSQEWITAQTLHDLAQRRIALSSS